MIVATDVSSASRSNSTSQANSLKASHCRSLVIHQWSLPTGRLNANCTTITLVLQFFSNAEKVIQLMVCNHKEIYNIRRNAVILAR